MKEVEPKVEIEMIKRKLKQVENSLKDFEKHHKMSSDEFLSGQFHH
jgi:hypothetical protein